MMCAISANGPPVISVCDASAYGVAISPIRASSPPNTPPVTNVVADHRPSDARQRAGVAGAALSGEHRRQARAPLRVGGQIIEKNGAAGDGGYAASGCAGKPYKFCEDFETGTVGALPTNWTQFKGYGAVGPTDVALASDEFHSGKMSLKSDSMDKGQARAQRSLAALGATVSNHWGRIFYLVQSPSPLPVNSKATNNGYFHVTFVSLLGPGNPGNQSEVRIVDTVEDSTGAHQWLYNLPSDGCCTQSAYSWKYDANWHCAEWWIDVATNSYRFFSDSAEVTALAFSGNAQAGMSAFADVVVGATFYQSTGIILSPFVIWFDDLAIDDNRIGCQ